MVNQHDDGTPMSPISFSTHSLRRKSTYCFFSILRISTRVIVALIDYTVNSDSDRLPKCSLKSIKKHEEEQDNEYIRIDPWLVARGVVLVQNHPTSGTGWA